MVLLSPWKDLPCGDCDGSLGGVAGAERSIDELSIGKQGIFAHCDCMPEKLDELACAVQVGGVVRRFAPLFLTDEDEAAGWRGGDARGLRHSPTGADSRTASTGARLRSAAHANIKSCWVFAALARWCTARNVRGREALSVGQERQWIPYHSCAMACIPESRNAFAAAPPVRRSHSARRPGLTSSVKVRNGQQRLSLST